MSKSAPKKLTIEHLRGSTVPFTLTFDPSKQLTVIYGENGTGKSTICDAFDFLARGSVGSLDNRGLGKTGRFWQSVGKNPKDVAVTLETTTGLCHGALGRTGVVVQPEDQRPRVQVLRRAQILSLLEATPAKRYEAIKKFIDVTGVEASESALRESIKSTQVSRDVAIARIQENRDSIVQFWQEAGTPGKNALQWAERESTHDTNVIEQESKALENLQKAFDRLADYPVKLSAAAQKLTIAQDALRDAQTLLDESIIKVTGDDADLVSLLEAAQTHFVVHSAPAVCPLCESSEKAADLVAGVNRRLDSLTTLRHARTNKSAKERDVQQESQQIDTLTRLAQEHAAEFSVSVSNVELPADTPRPNTSLPPSVMDWEAWLKMQSQLRTQWEKAAKDRADQKRFLGTLKRALLTLKENTRAQLELDALLPRLSRALELVEEERRTFTDAILKNIAAEVGRLNEQIHPGEGLNKISLALDPDKRASLEIGANFGTIQGTPPQAYFSESHLDTLGLCVFIALAKMDAPAETILVLDDILASVDEPHVERAITMLYEESCHFRHTVITTHYRPWKEKLRWGWLQNGQCHFVELAKWSEATGLSLVRSIPDIERLRLLLAETPPDPQLVCGKAGVILEALLDFLTLHFECNVPRKAGGYTLGDLLPNVDKKLRQTLKVEILDGVDASGAAIYRAVELRPYLDELQRIVQVRNVFGAHFNQLSFDLLDADALNFGQQVLGLATVLIDEQSGWPRNGNSGMYWATKGETRRLHPYKKPS